MNWSDSVLSLIDTRSFTNLWFWIMLAVVWSGTTHFILGVPFDMVQRARRQGGAAQQDLVAVGRGLGVERVEQGAGLAAAEHLQVVEVAAELLGQRGLVRQVDRRLLGGARPLRGQR